MDLNTISALLLRDLTKLEDEINSYPSDGALWEVAGEIKNSPGNLCLHLCGNLQHYIGAVLGKTGYVRNRPEEFSKRNLSRADLLNEIQKTKVAIQHALENLDPSILSVPFPDKISGNEVTTGYFLLHLFGHFNYHLGQINYHRRLIGVH